MSEDKGRIEVAAYYIRKYIAENPGIKDLAPMYEACPKYDRTHISQVLIGIEPWKHMSYIPEFSFYECGELTNVTIPEGVTSIGYVAFSGCVNLKSITLPNSMTSIGAGAFSDCYSLTSIIIPDSVTTIDDYAFMHCRSLRHIEFNGTIEHWESIDIGEGVFVNASVSKIICSDGTTNLKH